MQFGFVRLAGLVSATLLLAWQCADWQTEAPIFEPAQADALLFNSEGSRETYCKRDVSATAVSVEATVRNWARPTRWADAAFDGFESLGDLVTFTSTAHAQAPITSAQSGTAGSGPEGCSTANGTTTGNVTQCSTNQNASGTGGDGGQAGYGGKCSSDSGGTGFGGGTQTCSAYVPATPPVGTGSDNTACSAAGDGTQIQGKANCSAGGTGSDATGAVACSSAGGQSLDGSSDGAVVCSATGFQTSGNSCSTSGGGTTVTCSTYSGQHLACSAGQTTSGANVTATCSASGSSTGESTAMCSVNQAGTGTDDGPADGTKCTAIAYGASSGSTASCSTDQGAGGDGQCSVAAANTTTDGSGGKNTQCTAIPYMNNALPANYSCSASGVDPKDNTTCSVIQPKGGVTKPDGNDICGDPIHNHED